MRGEGGRKYCFVYLSSPYDSQSLTALWMTCKGGGIELEWTQSEEMVGQPILWGSVLFTSRSAVKLSAEGCSSGYTPFFKEFPLLHSGWKLFCRSEKSAITEDILLSLL